MDTIHGEAIPDPYRWLEAQDDPETRDWIDRQNAYAERIIGEPALRDQLRTRLRELMDVNWIGPTRKGGDFEYFTMRRAGPDKSSPSSTDARPRKTMLSFGSSQTKITRSFSTRMT